MLDSLIKIAMGKGASDLHLEPGLPAVFRIRGALESYGEQVKFDVLRTIAHRLIGDKYWAVFLEQCSFDLSTNIQGVRCRINILKTARGIGIAIRLLSSFQPTVKKLNLHPDIKNILNHNSGLALISGPTGSGKSSTMAALIQEINLNESKHIITIENPIEYYFKPQNSFIRQREVGRDTPSFSQGLIDSLREDPDILMIGEMREPEVMRLTLNAAETGHLVIATVHSGSVGEVLQRVVSSFPAVIQDGIRSQIADCIVAVVCQRLIYNPAIKLRIPECEILFSNFRVKSIIREGRFFKLNDVLQTGADDKMWTFSRYRDWLQSRKKWYYPSENRVPPSVNTPDNADETPKKALISDPLYTQPLPEHSEYSIPHVKERKKEGYYEIDDDDSFGEILNKLK